MEAETEPTADLYLRLAMRFRAPAPGSDPEAQAAYTRLFVIPGRATISPYESVHREGRLMGQAAEKASASYAEADLQLPSHLGELPDHISTELAFMAHLADQENKDPQGADRWRARQLAFLEQHLAQWVPGLCARILANDAHSFYHSAARLAVELIEGDRERLTSQAVQVPVASDAPLADRPSTPSFDKRFLNLTLQIPGHACTLCTLCADACQRRAISVRCEPRSISLIFYAAACNGCRACLRLCPEGAIQLLRGPALPAPPTEPPRVVLTAERVICPGCQQPHIAVPWLKRLQVLMRGQATLKRSLAYCPMCKVGERGDTSQSASAPQEVHAYG